MGDKQIQDRIQFRLRSVDTDLREAIVGMPSDKIAELARDGLRLILGIQTTKRMEVTERPIMVEQRKNNEETVTMRSKPAVYVPSQRRN